ncbi:MAG: diaminopropionate ammonia-lyase [Clostridium sp.]|uniref:diaminopropionate ammonia-lyase n=1 Tax=Clostridium sp. TaxID=1506 RepID=UPI0039EAF69E
MTNNNEIGWISNPIAREAEGNKFSTAFLSKDVVNGVRNFHKTLPDYERTPLHILKKLASHLGVDEIMVKDESYRFGLNAFKVLGGSYALGNYICNKIGEDIDKVSFEKLISKEVKDKIGDITFVTATDGNHGRGVAWMANKLGQKSVVFMPKGSSNIRLENIRAEGAEASITDLNYDDAVRLANKYAEENNGVMVQDTAWEGYEEIPNWIMQGYATLIDEAIEQVKEMGKEIPTHVFLQAGVGSFAGAIEGYLAEKFKGERPITTVVEPNEAACIYKSALMKDGGPHAVTGDMPTIMAGLACGEPNINGWKILRDYADMYISCPDNVSARGMRILGNPLKGDPKVVSGESGAVGLGILSLILEDSSLKEIAENLKLDEKSRILVISTEGDTDPENYRRITWDGLYQNK